MNPGKPDEPAIDDELFRVLFNNSPDPGLLIRNYEFVDCNQAALDLLGYSDREDVFKRPEELSPPQQPDGSASAEKAREMMDTALELGVHRFEWLHSRSDNSTFTTEVTLSRIPAGDQHMLYCIWRDITEWTHSVRRLKLFERIYKEVQEGICVTDEHGQIIDTNPSFSRITGYSRNEVLGQSTKILNSGLNSRHTYEEMWSALLAHGKWQGELWNRKRDGEEYAELLSISTLKDSEGQVLHYVGVFTDITEAKQQQSKLEMLAHYDELTGLPNRTLLADRLNLAIARSDRQGNQMAVCYLDLDGFKKVNDENGHDVGDQLLVEVAERIRHNIRDADTASRHGGDEFILLLGDLETYEECEHLLKRLSSSIAEPYRLAGHTVRVSVSIGVTMYPRDRSDADTLIRHADQAMYQAKMAGRNTYQLFDTEQNRLLTNRRDQLNEIRSAFEDEQFVLYYQPKVNMMTGEVLGAEALIRWQHPERGLIPPIAFLPVIENHQLELQIGDWVVEQALARIEQWQKAGRNWQISVNVSTRQLQSRSFLPAVQTALEKHPDVNSGLLQLEVLESSVLSDVRSISEAVTRIQETLGVSIALDDFGTGYSALSHLRHMPASLVKIDQGFVRDMLDDPNDYAIVGGVIGLTEVFQRGVIAEGVETMEHGLLLLAMGCHMAQGYGIARPMPADDLIGWAETWHAFNEWLDFGARPWSPAERTLRMLGLQKQVWLQRLATCLAQETGEHPAWPILDAAQCHCRRWTRQMRQDALVSPETRELIESACTEIHRSAETLQSLHQEGFQEEARDRLPELRAHCDKLQQSLKNLARTRRKE